MRKRTMLGVAGLCWTAFSAGTLVFHTDSSGILAYSKQLRSVFGALAIPTVLAFGGGFLLMLLPTLESNERRTARIASAFGLPISGGALLGLLAPSYAGMYVRLSGELVYLFSDVGAAFGSIAILCLCVLGLCSGQREPEECQELLPAIPPGYPTYPGYMQNSFPSMQPMQRQRPRGFGERLLAAFGFYRREEQPAQAFDPATMQMQMQMMLIQMMMQMQGRAPKAEDDFQPNNRLEAALHAMGVDCRVQDKITGARIIRYIVDAPLTAKAQAAMTSKKTAQGVARALGVSAVVITDNPERGGFSIDLPNREPQTVLLEEIQQPPKNRTEVSIGLTVEGKLVSIELERLPHLLIAGATGSGKSICLHVILSQLADRQGVALCIIDPKGCEFGVYGQAANSWGPVAVSAEDSAELLTEAVVEMERRFSVLHRAGRRQIGERMPALVIVIDEVESMLGEIPEALTPLTRLAQKGRAAAICLVLATQRPDRATLQKVSANITDRICFSVESGTDSNTILGFSGAEKLLGCGDGYLKTARGVERFQCAYVEEPEEDFAGDSAADSTGAELEDTAGMPIIFSDDPEEDSDIRAALAYCAARDKFSRSAMEKALGWGRERGQRIQQRLVELEIIPESDGTRHPRPINREKISVLVGARR